MDTPLGQDIRAARSINLNTALLMVNGVIAIHLHALLAQRNSLYKQLRDLDLEIALQ